VTGGGRSIVNLISPGCERTICVVQDHGSRAIYRLPHQANLSAKAIPIFRCYEIGRDDNFVTTEVGRHISWVTGGNIVLGGVIGLGVDLATGALYKLPSEIEVPLTCPSE
jgi:hypothetical protein